MKQIDVTKQVMEKVVRFEKKRSFWWFGRFSLILLVLLSVVIWSVWFSITQILERQTFELLTLFTEDRDIIGEFWLDTLTVFWEELPQKKLIISIIVFICIVIFILLKKKMLGIVWKKMHQLIKYKGSNKEAL